MENKITVKEFVKKYNTLTKDELKEQLVKSILTNKYISYENKVAICEKIVEASYYIKTRNADGVENKKLHVNSPANYMLYCLNIVNNYTSINVDFNNSLEEFNLLNGNECIDLIFAFISEREMKEFRMILDMVENDLMQNEYETHTFIRNQVERFGELTGVTLAPLLNVLIDKVENLDEKTVDKLIRGLSKLSK